MADYQETTAKFFVAKVSKRSNSIEYVSMNNFNGLLSSRAEMESGSFDAPRPAGMLINYLNNMYEELNMDFYCYLVRVAENNTHVISDAPEEYQAIVNSHFAEEEPVPEEETPDETEPAQ